MFRRRLYAAQEDLHKHFLSALEESRQVRRQFDDPFYLNKFRRRLLYADQKDFPLHRQIANGLEESSEVRRLIDAGVDVNAAIGEDQHTPLHIAALRHLVTASDLLEAKANINVKDSKGQTPLHLAVSDLTIYGGIDYCDVQLVKLLLRHEDIDIDPVDNYKMTPLMCAVEAGHFNAVDALLKKGANPNKPGRADWTALHEALYHRDPNLDIISALLKNGACLYSVDNEGRTPVGILVQRVIDNNNNLDLITESCFHLIALRYNIGKSLKLQLGKVKELSDYFEMCCNEVARMKKQIIYDNITLHDFACDCFFSRYPNTVIQIYIPVVEILVSGSYVEYKSEILNIMSQIGLRRVLCRIAGVQIFGEEYDHLFNEDTPLLDIYEEICSFYKVDRRREFVVYSNLDANLAITEGGDPVLETGSQFDKKIHTTVEEKNDNILDECILFFKF